MVGFCKWDNEPSGSTKWRKFFSVAEGLLASQEGLCSVELVSYLAFMCRQASDSEIPHFVSRIFFCDFMDLKTSVKKGFVFRRISIIAKNGYWLPHISTSASVCLLSHRTPFPRNFYVWRLFESLSKISIFIKIWRKQRALYVKIYVHFWQYLSVFFF